MKSKEIYDVLVRLENLKQIARVKQYAHLNDPLNKQKKKAFEEAHKEWVDQFELSQNVMNKYISEEDSLFNTSQAEKKIDHLNELVHADQERKRTMLGAMPEFCVKEVQPAPSRIRDMVIDAIRAHDKKIDCYAVDSNTIGFRNDIGTYEVRLFYHLYYFLDDLKGGHRSEIYHVKSYYDLRRNIQELLDNGTHFQTCSFYASGDFIIPKREGILNPKSSVVNSAIIQLLYENASLNIQNVAIGQSGVAMIASGLVAGAIQVLHKLGVDGEMNSYADNGCPHVGYIRVEDFEIWKDGVCNEEDFNAAKNFYGGGTDEHDPDQD